MKTFLTSVLIFLCLTSKVFADVPAVAFYVVRTDELRKLVPEDGSLEDVNLSVLEDISTAKGYFEGDCNLYLKTDDYQYRFKAVSSNETLAYSFRMFSQETKKNVFSSTGQVKVKEKFSAKNHWRQEEYAVLFRQQNLSK